MGVLNWRHKAFKLTMGESPDL